MCVRAYVCVIVCLRSNSIIHIMDSCLSGSLEKPDKEIESAVLPPNTLGSQECALFMTSTLPVYIMTFKNDQRTREV